MHIADGVLPPLVLAGGFAVTGGAVGFSLRSFRDERVPELGVLTGLFFIASLVPVPGTPVHLLLSGLLGIVLGPLSVLSVVVGLSFQAILLGHGGVFAIGVNAVVAGSGALASHAVFTWRWRSERPQRIALLAFAASFSGSLTSAAVFLLAMYSGGASLLPVGEVTIALQIPVALIEGLVTASIIAFLWKVKPEILSAHDGRRTTGTADGMDAGASVTAGAGAERHRPDALFLFLSIFALLASGATVHAHGLEALARTENHELVVKAFYSGSELPARKATVTVSEKSGATLARGVTDEKGVFRFRPQQPADLSVVVEDLSGHRAVIEIAAATLGSAEADVPADGSRPGSDVPYVAHSKAPGVSDYGPLWLRVAAGILGILVLFWFVRLVSSRRRS